MSFPGEPDKFGGGASRLKINATCKIIKGLQLPLFPTLDINPCEPWEYRPRELNLFKEKETGAYRHANLRGVIKNLSMAFHNQISEKQKPKSPR